MNITVTAETTTVEVRLPGVQGIPGTLSPEGLAASQAAIDAAVSAGIDAGTASTQAGVATTRAGEAATSAGNAATSESNAAASAGDAAVAKTGAENAEAAAAGYAALAAPQWVNLYSVEQASRANNITLWKAFNSNSSVQWLSSGGRTVPGCAEVTLAAANSGVSGLFSNESTGGRISVRAGYTYTITDYVKNTVGTRSLQARVLFYDSLTGANQIGSRIDGSIAVNPTGYTLVSVTFTVPAGATHAATLISPNNSGAIGDKFLVSDGMIYRSAAVSVATVPGGAAIPNPFAGDLWGPAGEPGGRWVALRDRNNDRPQVTYSDTGVAALTAILENGWTAGTVRITRYGRVVHMWCTGLSGAAASANTIITLPNGFRPQSTAYHFVPLSNVVGATTGTTIAVTSSGVVSQDRATVTEGQWSLTWTTTDALPSTVPGTPAGTVPT